MCINSHEKKMQELASQLNEKLKNLKTYEEFELFLKEMNNCEMGFSLYSKRSNHNAENFTHRYSNNSYRHNPLANLPKSLNKVDYLYSDGKSVGSSYVKNLWRYLEVR